MQSWLIYGLVASLFWGSWIIAAKVATSEAYFGIKPAYASVFVLAGIAVVFAVNIAIEGFQMPTSTLGMGAAVGAGALWAVGMIASFRALQAGADYASEDLRDINRILNHLSDLLCGQ
jgi:uncharacterized membrane protein